jgi:hypothetical protein
LELENFIPTIARQQKNIMFSAIRRLAHQAITTNSQRFLSTQVRRPPSPSNRFGSNGIVGGVVFGFVGGVYYYTVFQLRKQGDELMDELDELERELAIDRYEQKQKKVMTIGEAVEKRNKAAIEANK